ncbi:diphosphomevalonate decarboxylase isoform X2 [Sitophilus oryzae]|uniref:Diphosphomevalonate decarboxylase n=1 Tax=Sitophilus oryzae TaxID=7048 RepID=A0A6J2YI31_SITOR|nr:diphosphomevalonate decarboxylase isoform X2 [Sitophilus oryzae]
MKIVTAVAPVNIAVIKYWGKRDEKLILPINDSLSATLSTDVMCAKTTILTSPDLKENKFWLNGKEQSFDNVRLKNCLTEIKKRCNSTLPYINWKIAICSENNFPTAAGLASSAAGYACLVYALAALYEIDGEISDIARLGSGSACRSVYGGWVRWQKGILSSGEDSIARPIASASHWPEMRVLVLVVNDNQKKYGSTIGMNHSVETSTLIRYRSESVIPQRIEEINKAILERNFHKFAEITMKDSNQFHAICLDTYPPCIYMNDVSHAIVNLVHHYNTYKEENKVAYTFDAGPNACIYLLESVLQEFLSIVNYIFPKPMDIKANDYFKGLPLDQTIIKKELMDDLNLTQNNEGVLKYLICTKVGEGPRLLTSSNEHLLQENGLPK